MYRESEDGKQEKLFFTRRHSALEPQTKGNDYDPEKKRKKERNNVLFIYTNTPHWNTFDENIELWIHTSYKLQGTRYEVRAAYNIIQLFPF